MTKKQNIIEYIEAINGSFGCRTKYEQDIAGNMAERDQDIYLAAHYSTLLDDVIKAIGKNKLIQHLRTQDAFGKE